MDHKIPIGTLVEVKTDNIKRNGIRLFVIEHKNDCDGTPLYTLGIPGEEFCKSYGYNGKYLKIIKKPV